MSVTAEDIRAEFRNQVRLRAYEDRYIDRQEEREIMQIAISRGCNVDNARSYLQQVCETQGYILESQLIREVKSLLEIQAGNDGKIDRKEFDDAVSLVRRKCEGKRTESQIKRMICELINDSSFKTSTGWFSSWFNTVKREVGMA